MEYEASYESIIISHFFFLLTSHLFSFLIKESLMNLDMLTPGGCRRFFWSLIEVRPISTKICFHRATVLTICIGVFADA